MTSIGFRANINMTLNDAELGMEYTIRDIEANDEELQSFLFTLGCYSGEPVSVVSRKKSNLVLSIKNARYNIDMNLAAAIMI